VPACYYKKLCAAETCHQRFEISQPHNGKVAGIVVLPQSRLKRLQKFCGTRVINIKDIPCWQRGVRMWMAKKFAPHMGMATLALQGHINN